MSFCVINVGLETLGRDDDERNNYLYKDEKWNDASSLSRYTECFKGCTSSDFSQIFLHGHITDIAI